MYCDIDIIIIIKVTITLKSENSLTPVCMAKPLEAPATRRDELLGNLFTGGTVHTISSTAGCIVFTACRKCSGRFE